ncbi:amidohydrolase [Falsirhodobacter xinxiangensis]|uniref:amidohydrolase n=1 Tax=Falsirhodobacter xinxiangensis TaxID=2530049 RepID=UPI0010AAC794|nr:amidohydrolase [Rhodobacter xinxiangensis]
MGIQDFIALRREFHQNPELAFSETETGNRIAALLEGWGFSVTRMGGTGVVASLGNGPRAIAIRADIDALPITEATGLSFASRVPGVMHACGHDGHSAILLAAAYDLSRRPPPGRVVLIFQPAEEIGAGSLKLIQEGLFDRFPVDAVFGLHNWPGMPAGQFGFVEGPAMAAVDKVAARIVGRGGHGAEPHLANDPVVAAAQAISALQSIVSRNVDPLEMAVVTVGSIHGGEVHNVIPGAVDLSLSLRSYSPGVREVLAERVPAILHSVAHAFGAVAEVDYRRGIPSVVNSVAETRLVRQVAVDTLGADAVIEGFRPRTASEDFAHYLDHRPGSFIFVGNGDSAPLHSPEYRFDDGAIGPAAQLWVALAHRFTDPEAQAQNR